MTAIVVRPVRFTDNIEPMQAFLELIGLRPRIESVGGGWVDLVIMRRGRERTHLVHEIAQPSRRRRQEHTARLD